MTTQNSSTPIWLIYLAGWITGLIFLATEKNDEDVRWHAANSTAIFGAVTILSIVLRILVVIPFLGILFAIVSWLLGVGVFILWIVLMVRGSQGDKVRVPVATDFAEQNLLNLFK